MLVKDEADIIDSTIGHLTDEVDHIIVADNLSSDGTREILAQWAHDAPGFITVQDDTVVAYMQSDKTTALAMQAYALGHTWVLPVDADECWIADDGRRIRDWLNGISPDVRVVRALLYNHIPTALDDEDETNPFRRIGWRQTDHAPAKFGKVAVRCGPNVVIEMGNHGAYMPGRKTEGGGLTVRHYSWRSAAQYVRKIQNGATAYAASGLAEGFGGHWRMFGDDPDPEAVADHFHEWFWRADPEADDSLVYDPAPVG